MSLIIGVDHHVPLYILLSMTSEGTFRTVILYILYMHDSNMLSKGRFTFKGLSTVRTYEILRFSVHSTVYV